MDGRTFLQAFGITLLSAYPAKAQPDAKEQQLIALIGELEIPPGFETCTTHWTKAFAAAEIRKILGLPIPDSEHLKSYWRCHEAQVEWGRKWDAMQAAKSAT